MYIDTSGHPPLVIYLSEICFTLHWCPVPFDCIEWCELNRLFFLDEVIAAQWLCHPVDRFHCCTVDPMLPLIDGISSQWMHCSLWSKSLLISWCTVPTDQSYCCKLKWMHCSLKLRSLMYSGYPATIDRVILAQLMHCSLWSMLLLHSISTLIDVIAAQCINCSLLSRSLTEGKWIYCSICLLPRSWMYSWCAAPSDQCYAAQEIHCYLLLSSLLHNG